MGGVRSRHLAAISLLVLIGFFVGAVSLNAQSMWRDEVDALRFATAPWSELLSTFTRPGWNGPLYHLLLRGWISLAGVGEYSLRFFSLAFGLLSIPMIYALGRRLFHPLAGVIAAVLTVGSPYLIWYSQEVKMYTLVVVLALLAIYSLRRALDAGSWRWWLTQFTATSLALYVHVLAALLIPVQLLLCAVWWSRARERWTAAGVSFACLILPYLPLLIWQAPLALEVRDTGFSAYSLHQMIVVLLNGWATGITGWGRSWAAMLMGFLASITLFAGIAHPLVFGDVEADPVPRSRIADFLALALWLTVPLVAIWVISLRQPLFTDRYLIWCAPAFYLLIASGLSRLMRVQGWGRWLTAVLLGAVLVANGVNLWRQATTAIRSDFRGAAAFVADYQERVETVEHPRPVTSAAFQTYLPIVGGGPSESDSLIVFQIPYGKYTFDYYFPTEGYPAAEGLYTNHRGPDGGYLVSEQQAAWHMRQMTDGHAEVWLIATEVSMWDERNLVQRWLDEHFQRAAEARFSRVDVYRYVRSVSQHPSAP